MKTSNILRKLFLYNTFAKFISVESFKKKQIVAIYDGLVAQPENLSLTKVWLRRAHMPNKYSLDG